MTFAKTTRSGGGIALALMLVGCTSLGLGRNEGEKLVEWVADPPIKANAPTLLIAMPHSREFMDVRRGLITEVKKNFNVVTFLVSGETKPDELLGTIEKVKPVCTILMNNTTVNLYRQLEVAGKDVPPAVVVMSSFVEEVRAKLKRATGIAYEVPGVTAFVNLRSVIMAPINRVGVVYRVPFKAFIEKQKELALREHVELIAEQVAGDISADGLRATLQKLVQVSKVDAMWMLNDNRLLRDLDFIDQSWRAVLSSSKVPLIVGVPNLVDPNASLGTLAVVPDHEALGFQTANLVFDLQDNNWQATEHALELPLSVKTIVDLRSVRATFGLKPDALRFVDKALE